MSRPEEPAPDAAVAPTDAARAPGPPSGPRPPGAPWPEPAWRPGDPALSFALEAVDGAARAGRLTLSGLEIETPAFMPVGTRAAVRCVDVEDLLSMGYRLILANTYHLMLRPGGEGLAERGGLQRFWSWPGRVLTDSGGFQVFSLAKLAKTTEDGVIFQSHLDGTRYELTPERSMVLQCQFGSDIVMAFDECLPWPLTHEEAKRRTERSFAWTRRSRTAFAGLRQPHQAFFGILQGGGYDDLRRWSAEAVMGLACDGHAIGGLAIGEPREVMTHQVEVACGVLPADKPRYLMGVGTPEDLLDAVARGVDMFDCVLPTRSARHTHAYTCSEGKLNLRNARFRTDDQPVEHGCPCPTCRRYSRAYLHHLVKNGEETGSRLMTLHNLTHYRRLMEGMRRAIPAGRFQEFRTRYLGRSW